MIVIWTNNAKNDLIYYKQNSKITTEEKIENYINSLIDYINTLNNFHNLGKFLFNNSNFEIRQLIYHKHRIFYAINDNNIYILNIIHVSRNIEGIVKYLKNKKFNIN